MIEIRVRASEIVCPRKIPLGNIICMTDDIVLNVNKGFLSHKCRSTLPVAVCLVN